MADPVQAVEVVADVVELVEKDRKVDKSKSEIKEPFRNTAPLLLYFIEHHSRMHDQVTSSNNRER